MAWREVELCSQVLSIAGFCVMKLGEADADALICHMDFAQQCAV